MHRRKILVLMKYVNCEVTNLYGVGRTLLLVSDVRYWMTPFLRQKPAALVTNSNSIWLQV